MDLTLRSIMGGVAMLADESGADYDHRFPDSLGSYRAGTVVLARDDRVYRCKPFPFSGWCNTWSRGTNQYEPGMGSHWQEAWTRVD